MAIVTFTSAQPGPQGPQGPVNTRDINSIIMLAWLGSEPIMKGFDIYTNNFSTDLGIDSSSIAIYNSAGYYETPVSADQHVYEKKLTADVLYREDYKGSIYKWCQDEGSYGHFEGVPQVLTSGVAVVDKGGAPNKVGLACEGHSFSTASFIEVRGTINYNGTFVVNADSTTDEIVIESGYTAETLSNTGVAHQRITLGAGLENERVSRGMCVEFFNSYNTIQQITGSGYRNSEVQLINTQHSNIVTGIYDTIVTADGVSPSWYYSTTASGWSRIVNNSPDPRRDSAMEYDPTTKNFFLFGGYRYGTSLRTNELWKYSTVSGQWSQLYPAVSPTAREKHCLALDPVNNTLIMWGGSTGSASNELWKYTIATNTWLQLSPTGGPPSARYSSSFTYMPASGVFLMYGGYTGAARPKDLWEYSPSLNRWAQKTYTGTPIPASDHSAICQTVSGALIVQGGYNSAGTINNETWKYNHTANAWTKLSNAPATVRGHAACYADGYMYIVVAYPAGSLSFSNAVWRFSFDADSYSVISPTFPFTYGPGYFAWAYNSDNNTFNIYSGEMYSSNTMASFLQYSIASNTWAELFPSARAAAAGAIDGEGNFYIVAGDNPINYGFFTDIWYFDPVTSNYTLVSCANKPATENRSNTSLHYSSKLNCFFMFSGDNSASNDLWKFDIETQNWFQVTPIGFIPSARYRYAGAYDTTEDVLYILSGYTETGFWGYSALSNVWFQLPLNGNNPENGVYREGSEMCYDSINHCLWLFGGYRSSVYKNDLWKYDIATSTWIQILYQGYTPAIRSQMKMVYDRVTQSVFIFGGYNGTVYYNDLMRYDVQSNTMHLITDILTSSNSIVGKAWPVVAFDEQLGDLYSWGGSTVGASCTAELVKYNVRDSVTVSGIVGVTTSGLGLSTQAWQQLSSIIPNYETPGSSQLYHQLSFDSGSSYNILSAGASLPLEGAASDKGSGLVGFTVTQHGLVEGNFIRVAGTSNYNYNYYVGGTTTTNEVVVSGSYVAEAFTPSAYLKKIVGWLPVVQISGSSWQYRAANDAWESASPNTVNNAIASSLTVSGNRMDSLALSQIRPVEYNLVGGFSSNTESIEFGIGLVAESSYISELNSYTIEYLADAGDLVLITETWEASQNDPTSCVCLFKIHTIQNIVLDSDLKAWVSVDDGVNYEQITGLSILREEGHYKYIQGLKSSITARSNNKVKLKLTTHNGKLVSVFSVGLSVG